MEKLWVWISLYGCTFCGILIGLGVAKSNPRLVLCGIFMALIYSLIALFNLNKLK